MAQQQKKNPVTWFEIPVTDIVRAKEFYEHAFEYQLSFQEMKKMKMAQFPMEDGSGISGSLVQATGYDPHLSGTIVYFSVDDIEKTLSRIQQKGGKQLIPKTSIGEYGYIAHFEDCEGNQIGLHAMQ